MTSEEPIKRKRTASTNGRINGAQSDDDEIIFLGESEGTKRKDHLDFARRLVVILIDNSPAFAPMLQMSEPFPLTRTKPAVFKPDPPPALAPNARAEVIGNLCSGFPEPSQQLCHFPSA